MPNFTARALHLLHISAGMFDDLVKAKSSLPCMYFDTVVMLPKSMFTPLI